MRIHTTGCRLEANHESHLLVDYFELDDGYGGSVEHVAGGKWSRTKKGLMKMYKKELQLAEIVKGKDDYR